MKVHVGNMTKLLTEKLCLKKMWQRIQRYRLEGLGKAHLRWGDLDFGYVCDRWKAKRGKHSNMENGRPWDESVNE